MTTEPRCALVVRTGLPDDVRCGRKAVYAVGASAYPVCAAHLAKELQIITGSLSLAGRHSGGIGAQVTVTRLVP